MKLVAIKICNKMSSKGSSQLPFRRVTVKKCSPVSLLWCVFNALSEMADFGTVPLNAFKSTEHSTQS